MGKPALEACPLRHVGLNGRSLLPDGRRESVTQTSRNIQDRGMAGHVVGEQSQNGPPYYTGEDRETVGTGSHARSEPRTGHFHQQSYRQSHSPEARLFFKCSLFLFFTPINMFIYLFICVIVMVMICLCLYLVKCGVYLSFCVCGGQRTTCAIQFSPSIMWVIGVNPMSSALAGSPITH